MDIVGITHGDCVREADATLKTSIKFTNWNNDGKHYWHNVDGGLCRVDNADLPIFYLYAIANGISNQDIFANPPLSPDCFLGIGDEMPNQFHFDTFKLNEFLKRLCKERDIALVEDDINDVVLNEYGHVEYLLGEKQNHYADFFIDSSGFNSVIANKVGKNWRSMEEYLPTNTAFAFPSKGLENPPAYTECIAMSSGWMWRAPTQKRFGNGYVYNNNFITDEQAEQEVRNYLQQDFEIAKKVKFTAKHTDQYWIKNTCSIGLSGCFVEPLEASSIGMTILQSIDLAQSIVAWQKGHEKISNKFNETYRNVFQNIIDFVQIHYFTKRNDTEFWKNCHNIKLTDFNEEFFEHMKNNVPTNMLFDTRGYMFRRNNFIEVMHGLEQFDPPMIDMCKKYISKYIDIKENFDRITNRDGFYDSYQKYSHSDVLNYMRQL